ncbi:unnamed protein product [Macrosiphum euphorbiae]|uniref:DDE-1 domain-containing protein n=1 Tax=Macrosiphum euphorbiae TaxID=13131 RepID=A0AAV0WPE9_9HEMI|nr:unnamed protein product [Macrosiphum euphorbiae]
MSGTEKLKLFVIGKAKKPRCFKGIKSLPVDYRSNKKAWMTSSLFSEWLLNFDRKMKLENRKVLLFIDNCTAHNHDIELSSIKVHFLPPNTTPILQPMDQGVIQNFKMFYRKEIIRQFFLIRLGEASLANFVETTTGMDDKAFSALNNLEDVVAERSNMKQTLITDFFKEK